MPSKLEQKVAKIILETGGSDNLIELDDGTAIVDSSGNIDAPVTTSNLSTTGTTTLGDGTSDDTTVSGDLTVDVDTILSGKVIPNSTETIAAGGTSTALDLTKFHHDIDADAGGDTFTLANGVEGQITVCVMKSATGTATITPATFLGGTSITFNAAGDSVMLRFQDTLGWSIIGGNSYGVS